MRIIFVTRHLTNGGAEREVAAFANALVQIGQEVCITYLHNIGIDYALDPRVQTFWQSPSRVSVPKLRGLCNHILSIKQLRGLSGDVLISDNISGYPEKVSWRNRPFYQRRKAASAEESGAVN